MTFAAVPRMRPLGASDAHPVGMGPTPPRFEFPKRSLTMKVFLVVLAFVVLMPIVAWAGHSARHPRERPDYAGEGYRGPNDYRTPTPYPPIRVGI